MPRQMKAEPQPLDFEDHTRELDPTDRPHYHFSITQSDCLALTRGEVTAAVKQSALVMIRAWDPTYDPRKT